MLGRIAAALAAALALLARPGPTVAGPVCPDSSYAVASFGCTYTGNYKPGQPYDTVTIWPAGSVSDTFAESGIAVHVLVRDCQGNPIPSATVELHNDSLCVVGSSNTFTTGPDGRATFAGRFSGKGFCKILSVLANGVPIGVVPVRINGPGPGGGLIPHPDCCVTISNFAGFVAALPSENGAGSGYSINSDFNEDGFVDLVDWVIWTQHVRAFCVAKSTGEAKP